MDSEKRFDRNLLVTESSGPEYTVPTESTLSPTSALKGVKDHT